MIITKRFWQQEKNGIRGHYSYPDKRSAKGFFTQYGGKLLEQMTIDDNLIDPETEDLMTIIERIGPPATYPYLIVYGPDFKRLMSCETLKQANEIAKALGQCQKNVYVVKINVD